MYRVIIAVHIIGILACVFMLCLLLCRKEKKTNPFIILAIVFNIFILTGYSFELLSGTKEEMLMSIQLGYIGKCFCGICFVTGIGEYYHWTFKKYTLPALWSIACVGVLVILTAKFHKLYYTNVELYWSNGHAFCRLSRAPFYYVFMTYIIGLFLYFIYRCVLYKKKTDSKTEKKVMHIVICGTVAAVTGVLASMIFSKKYDFCPLIFAVYSMVFLYCILRYRMFDTVDTAIYQMAAENSQAILVTRADGKPEYVNKMAVRLLDWMDDMDQKSTMNRIRETFLSGQTECLIHEKSYRIAVSDVSDGTKVIGHTITLTDITDLKRHAAELEKLSEQANEANRAKSDFLANMSHEIRTPINTILGMNEMILRESYSEEITGYAANIKEAGRSLLSIVNDILDLSKIESGKMQIIPVNYKFSDLLDDLVNMIGLKAQDKGLAFELEIDETIPSVLRGDDVRIRQILYNILTNAVKYTKEGSVTLRISGKRTEKKYYMLHVEVEDTGIGIRDEDQEKLFASFQRLDEKKNRNIEGTGLGMSITASFLHMMGSEIKVQSEYGKGSVFYFDLRQYIADEKPIGIFHKGEAGSKKNAPSSEPTFTAPKARVLVVDDNKMNLEVFRGLLKGTQIQVTTADSGKEAIRLMDGNSFDVVFMDHMMPELDGIETFERVREIWDTEPGRMKTGEGTPVVILTANAISGAKEMYLSKGFTDYLSKPIDFEQLDSLLRELLPKELVHVTVPGQNSESAEEATQQTEPAGRKTPDGAEQQTEQTKDGAPEEASRLQILVPYGFAIEEGLKYMGQSVETYEEILSLYFSELSGKLQRLSDNLEQENLKDYAIDAHSMKSTSKSVGALRLSELAKEHELKSKENDIAFVREHFGELKAECEHILAAGAAYAGQEAQQGD